MKNAKPVIKGHGKSRIAAEEDLVGFSTPQGQGGGDCPVFLKLNLQA